MWVVGVELRVKVLNHLSILGPYFCSLVDFLLINLFIDFTSQSQLLPSAPPCCTLSSPSIHLSTSHIREVPLPFLPHTNTPSHIKRAYQVT